MEESPFLYLTCDLPQPPLFKDEKKENIIPQVHIEIYIVEIQIAFSLELELIFFQSAHCYM